MQNVEVMSTVSGGSIIGAYYLIQMERKLSANPARRKDRLAVCDEIISEFSKKLQLNFRMRALLFFPFYRPLDTVLLMLRLRHGGDTMASEFERHLFAPELRIGDLPVQTMHSEDASGNLPSIRVENTRLLANTTSLITGRRFVISRENDLGIKAQIHKSDPNQISLARVVGASAAVPGLFKPLRIGNELLADGGVVDNQGLESLFDYFEISEPSLNLIPQAMRQPASLRVKLPPTKAGGEDQVQPNGTICFFVSDAAGQFAVKDGAKSTRSGSAARSMSILQAENRRKVLKLLLEIQEHSGDHYDFKFAFTHLAMNLKGVPGVEDDRLPSEFIVPTADLRTDLDDFTRLERDVLIYHGYTLMKNQVERYLSPLLKKYSFASSKSPVSGAGDPDFFSWPPPFLEVCDSKAGFSNRAEQARLKIETFLRIGQKPVFRDWKRYPWPIAPILAAFVILALVIGKILTNPLTLLGGFCFKEFLVGVMRKGILALIPKIEIPYLVNLTEIEKAFQQGGDYFGSVNLLASLSCYAVGFYLAMYLFWMAKRWTRLPERCESNMMDRLRNIPSDQPSVPKKASSSKATGSGGNS